MAYFTASCDTAETNKKFAESLSLDYPILSDPTTKTAQAYGLVKAGGKNAARVTVYVGKNGKILEIDNKVNAASHGADIAKKLEALGVEEK